MAREKGIFNFMDITISYPPRTGRGWFWGGVAWLVFAHATLACLALFVMALLTCADVVARKAGLAFTGAYDVVRILSVLALAGALPVTTAAKGHVAIEYFFNMLGPRSRLGVDSLMRALMIAALGCAAWALVLCGNRVLASGEVTATLQLPFFWTYWVLAASCVLTSLVVLFHLVKPGKVLVKL